MQVYSKKNNTSHCYVIDMQKKINPCKFGTIFQNNTQLKCSQKCNHKKEKIGFRSFSKINKDYKLYLFLTLSSDSYYKKNNSKDYKQHIFYLII